MSRQNSLRRSGENTSGSSPASERKSTPGCSFFSPCLNLYFPRNRDVLAVKFSYLTRGRAASPSSGKLPYRRVLRRISTLVFTSISEINILRPIFEKKRARLYIVKSHALYAHINFTYQKCPNTKLYHLLIFLLCLCFFFDWPCRPHGQRTMRPENAEEF